MGSLQVEDTPTVLPLGRARAMEDLSADRAQRPPTHFWQTNGAPPSGLDAFSIHAQQASAPTTHVPVD